MSLPLWSPTTAVPICPEHFRPWRPKPGRLTVPLALTRVPAMTRTASFKKPSVRLPLSATPGAGAAWARRFPG